MNVKPQLAIASESQCFFIKEFLIKSVVFIIFFSGCDICPARLFFVPA
jgi:hypothetical protein